MIRELLMKRAIARMSHREDLGKSTKRATSSKATPRLVTTCRDAQRIADLPHLYGLQRTYEALEMGFGYCEKIDQVDTGRLFQALVGTKLQPRLVPRAMSM